MLNCTVLKYKNTVQFFFIVKRGERMEYQIMTISDLLSNMIDNVSDSQLDKEIKNFSFYAKKLGVRDYDSLYVAISEEDPSYVLQDELMIPSLDNDRELYLYPSAKVLVEKYNGEIYVYSVSEDAIKEVFDTMDKFMSEESLEVDFISDDDYKMETEENNKSFVDISECLKLRDNRNSNKYNLQNMYLSEKYSYEQKLKLAYMLKESVSDEEIYTYMQSLKNDEESMDAMYKVREPYAAAEADALSDIEHNTPLNFDPDAEEDIIQDLMGRENWDRDQAKEYFAHYWEVYENYLKDEYSVDDDFDWGMEID